MGRIRLISMAAVLLAGVLVWNMPGFADTYVGGRITEDTVWDKAGSPYILTEDLTIDQGVTLTIELGVVVYGNDEMYKRYGIYVEGGLIAKGTPKERIVFDRGPGWQWGGIYFKDSSDDKRSILQYCDIVNANTAIVCAFAAPQIIGCKIQAEVCGLQISGKPSDVAVIKNNEIVHCRWGILTGSAPLIEGNLIKGNKIGISCAESARPVIVGNDLFDVVTSSSEYTIDAKGNYWGESALLRMEKRERRHGMRVNFSERAVGLHFTRKPWEKQR